MRKLVTALTGLLLVVNVGIAQDETPRDTVNFVDFIVSVIQRDSSTYNETRECFELRNVVLDVKGTANLSDLIHARFNSPSDSTIVVKQPIRLTNFTTNWEGLDEKGQQTYLLIIEGINFNGGLELHRADDVYSIFQDLIINEKFVYKPLYKPDGTTKSCLTLRHSKVKSAMISAEMVWILDSELSNGAFITASEGIVLKDNLVLGGIDSTLSWSWENGIAPENAKLALRLQGEGAKLSLQNNHFQESNLSFKGSFSSVIVAENNLGNSRLIFGDTKVNDKLFVFNNDSIRSINLERVLFSEFKNIVRWNDIGDFKLHATSDFNSNKAAYEQSYLSGDSAELYKDELAFQVLLGTYKTLYDQYKTNGFTPDANACYAEMKVLETRWWKQQYKEQPSFENYFRWKLNEFLNFFTDYGTNPAKAVVKSIWVILIFSVFYLFFPSDWDVSNRSELLKRGKELFSKNRSTGILANLGFLLYTGFIHALNAITLSMNAFTTLGFGDIPTRGAARYVTIVQGLIGWFLLTIFSVSLINQVLG